MRLTTIERLQALTRALELLGFNLDAMVGRMADTTHSAQYELALRSVRIHFDEWSARRLVPCISPEALATAQGWFDGVRARPERPLRMPRLQAKRRSRD